MEAVTIAGLAVVAVGGYFSLLDFLNEAGFAGMVKKSDSKKSFARERDIITSQSRIKKVAGMHI
jgi:hypothetical protein